MFGKIFEHDIDTDIWKLQFLRGEPGVAKILSGTSKLEAMEVAGSREAEVNASIDRKLRSNSASGPGGAALGRQCLRAVL